MSDHPTFKTPKEWCYHCQFAHKIGEPHMVRKERKASRHVVSPPLKKEINATTAIGEQPDDVPKMRAPVVPRIRRRGQGAA